MKLFSAEETAQLLKVSLRAVQSALQAGTIPDATFQEEHWYIPETVIVNSTTVLSGGKHRITWAATAMTKFTREQRCPLCSIPFVNSGDAEHGDDAEGSTRCWWCRQTYGSQPTSIIMARLLLAFPDLKG